MLNAAGNFLRRIAAKAAVLWFFVAIAFVSELSVFVMLAPVGFDSVWALQTTLSTEVFQAQLAGMFERGVAEQYIAHYYYDFVNPFWYSALVAVLLARGMNAAGVPASASALALLPFLAGLLDQVQNLLHLYMVLDTANVAPALVLLANVAGLLKLALLALCLLAVPALLAAAHARRRG